MIRVVLKKLNSEDCIALARITASAQRGTPLESDMSLDDVAETIEKLSASDGVQVLVAQDESGVILGWIHYYVDIPPMAFINGFLPIVEPTDRTEEVALAIIEAAKRDIIARRFTRLEIELKLQTDAHRIMSKTLVNWYEKCDFQFAAEEVHMSSDLTSLSLPRLNPPKNCVLRKITEVSYEQLKKAGFQTFDDSKNDLFISMNRVEREVNLKYFFDTSKPFIEDASFVLERDGKIIGFIVTRPRIDDAEIGPVGLIPEARGEGLANYLLGFALKNLRDSGLTSATLDMAVANWPARKLYKKYGFEDIYYKQFYYWSP
jgi:ribosomal protein S18 acetylase RimI-like enzyme